MARRSIVDSVPDRSTATLRGFAPALNRSFVIGGPAAAGVATVLSLTVVDLSTSFLGPPVIALGSTLVGFVVALAESRDRFMAGDPEGLAPLEAARSSLGSAPTAVILRDTWLPVAAAYLLIGFAASMVVSLSRLLV